MFGHVLTYLRDGVVAAGCEGDMVLLRRLQRECSFYCQEEQKVVLAVGGFDPNTGGYLKRGAI